MVLQVRHRPKQSDRTKLGSGTVMLTMRRRKRKDWLTSPAAMLMGSQCFRDGAPSPASSQAIALPAPSPPSAIILRKSTPGKTMRDASNVESTFFERDREVQDFPEPAGPLNMTTLFR